MNKDKAGAAITLGIALGVNVTVTILKGVAAAVTGSTATAAECLHSLVDTTNQVLMGIGLWHSHRTGRAYLEYVWGVAAAGAMFVTGGVWAVYDGLRQLVNPDTNSSILWAVAVLGLSMALESVSLTRAASELWREKGDRSFWACLGDSQNLTTVATFYEDLSDVGGDALALAAVGLAWATGFDGWDAYAAIAIGSIVGWLATRIARNNRRLWKEAVTA